MTLIIDPENISLEDQNKLIQFFSVQAKLGTLFWSTHTTYTFSDGTPFRFRYRVIKRERKEGKEDFRYEFISDELIGEGTWGRVYKIKGTLGGLSSNNFQYNPAGYINKHGVVRSRVVKIQSHEPMLTSEEEEPNIENEYLNASTAALFSIKKPVTHEYSYFKRINNTEKRINKKYTFLVMEEAPGVDLDDLLEHNLSLYQRIEISKQIIAKVKKLKDKKIIHRDIKCGNFKVDLNYPIRVTLLDFGLSTDAVEPNRIEGGSNLYVSPDMFNGSPHTYGLDVFSLGRCLQRLWGMPEEIWEEDWGNGLYPADLDFLFHNIEGLDPEQKNIIRSAIKGMMDIRLERRVEIETVIEAFDSLGDFSYEEALYKLETLNHPLGGSLLRVINRLEKGATSKNPYWMNASTKLVEIISAVLDSDDLVGAMSDLDSPLYKSVNMQRITPGSFFGQSVKAKSLKIIEDQNAFSCLFH